MPYPRIILASSSPRRKELLEAAGFVFAIDSADVDETRLPGEGPEPYALRAALAKARETAARYASGVVVGADTIVVVDGDVFGKPASEDEARAMLARISDRGHRVLTAVAVVDAASGRERSFVEETEVFFRALSAEEIEEYVATGEPMDKAGAYGIQGRASVYVLGVRGCFFNVVGLPVARLAEELKGFS